MAFLEGFFNLFKTKITPGETFIPWKFLHPTPQFNNYMEEEAKIKVAFSNPALLKVIVLQCDLFSMAKLKVYNKSGNLVEDDPAVKKLMSPNPFQDQSQWLWDYMFWKMLGNAYMYMDSRIVDRDNAPMYWLNPSRMEWPIEIENAKDKLIFSQGRWKDLMKMEIKYIYQDGTSTKIPLEKIIHIPDLSDGTGNFFKSFSRIDALTKPITNSERSLDSKEINVRYAGKFMVAGKQDPRDVSKTPMDEDEKKSIEETMNGEKVVHGVKSMIDIKRFVDDLRVLELDKSFLADYYLIGSMYNIPRDVLEAYQSSTFENQEKARAGHIMYTLQPAGEILGNNLYLSWEYKPGWKICFSWDHLPTTQVYEKERSNLNKVKIDTMNLMLKMGIPIEEINKFLGTNFTIDETKRNQETQRNSK